MAKFAYSIGLLRKKGTVLYQGVKNLQDAGAQAGGAVEVAVGLMCAPVVVVEDGGGAFEVGDGAGDFDANVAFVSRLPQLEIYLHLFAALSR